MFASRTPYTSFHVAILAAIGTSRRLPGAPSTDMQTILLLCPLTHLGPQLHRYALQPDLLALLSNHKMVKIRALQIGRGQILLMRMTWNPALGALLLPCTPWNLNSMALETGFIEIITRNSLVM